MLPQGKRRFEHLAGFTGRGLDPHTGTRIEGLTGPTKQLGLVIEEIHLAGPAIHEQLDHPPGPGSMVRPVPHSSRIQARSVVAGQDLAQGNTSETSPQLPNKIATGNPNALVQSCGVHGRNKNSLLLKSNRQALARPCCCA